MAQIIGGILGNVKGKTSGVVFSMARSRTGKVNTVRQFVTPSNPNTAGQQTQRTYFTAAQGSIKLWGPDMYQTDFNRAVQQLPGFQSLMSIIMSNIKPAGGFDAPGDVPLGDLHFPDTLTIAMGGAQGEIDVTWSTENGSNGTSNDLVKCAIYCQDSGEYNKASAKISGLTRADGAAGWTFTGLTPSSWYNVLVWIVGAGLAEGNISKCSSGPAEAHA